MAKLQARLREDQVLQIFGETVIIRRDPGAGQSLATAVIEEIVPPGLGALHRHGPWQRSYGACNAMSRKLAIQQPQVVCPTLVTVIAPALVPLQSVNHAIDTLASRSWSHG